MRGNNCTTLPSTFSKCNCFIYDLARGAKTGSKLRALPSPSNDLGFQLRHMCWSMLLWAQLPLAVLFSLLPTIGVSVSLFSCNHNFHPIYDCLLSKIEFNLAREI